MGEWRRPLDSRLITKTTVSQSSPNITLLILRKRSKLGYTTSFNIDAFLITTIVAINLC